MKNISAFLTLSASMAAAAVSANTSAHKPLRPKYKVSASSAAHKSSASPVVDTWKPDPKLLDNLTDETQASGYALRLPEGYSEVPQPPAMAAQRQNGFDAHVFSMSRRSDGTAATLGFVVATPPPSVGEMPTLNDALEGALEQKKHQWQDFTESAVQDGHVNGLAFKRVYFKGTISGPAGTRMAHGFAYASVDGNHILNLQAEDVEPYNDDTMPIAQAAVLTFRKRPAP